MISVQTNGSPVLQLESDQNGFLIWKSLMNGDNAASVCQYLPTEPELTQVLFSFATEGWQLYSSTLVNSDWRSAKIASASRCESAAMSLCS
jgi:hypothetical protein